MQRLARKGQNSFLLLGLVTVVISSVTSWAVVQFRAGAGLVEHSHEVLTAVSSLDASIIRAESAMRAYLITVRPTFLSEFSVRRQDVENNAAILRTLVSDNPEQAHRVLELSSAAARRLYDLMQSAEARRAGLSPEEIARRRGPEANRLIAELTSLTAAVRDSELHRLDDRQRSRFHTEAALLALCLFGVLASIALFWTGQRAIRSYRLIRDTAERDLQVLNANLEQRVTERTASIQQVNSELQRSQEELSGIVQVLTRSNIELESFAYAATHDLQEPLRTINLFSQLLQRRFGALFTGDAAEYLRTIRGASIRMSELIQGLLEYSRVRGDAGGFIELLRLADIIDIVRQNLSAQIQDAGARIDYGDLPQLTANRLELISLLQNLIGNAIKYRDPGRPSVVTIAARRQDGHWIVSVQDNGVGFSPEYRELIFGVFKRLERAYPGAGVGLAICRTIVERYGGRIWAEAEPGRGALFSFTWPVAVSVKPAPALAAHS